MAIPLEATRAPETRNRTGEAYFSDLLPALRRLDQLLERAARAVPTAYGPQSVSDPYRGLYINHDEVARLLARAPGAPTLWTGDDGDAHEESLSDSLDASRINWLGRTFDLSAFDMDLILIALAPELDLRYERLFAYLQDDVTRRRPGVDLALNLLCASAEAKLMRRTHFAPDAPLMRHGLLHLVPDSSQIQPPLLAHYLKLDEQVTNLLLGERVPDSRLVSAAQIVEPCERLDELPLCAETKSALLSLFRRAKEAQRPARFYFHGPSSADKRRAAEALCAETGARLLVVDLCASQFAETDFERVIKLVFREARFHESVLYLDGLDALRDRSKAFQYQRLWAALIEDEGITIMAGDEPCVPPLMGAEPAGIINVPIGIPDFALRRECWRASSEAAGVTLDESELETLSGRFRLTPFQIAQAVRDAGNRALWREAAQSSDLEHSALEAKPAASDLSFAARAQSGHSLAALARKIEPVYSWKDIVLTEDALAQLRELCQQVAHRERVISTWGFGRKLSLGKGISALFAGPSGTGKTMAAEVIARELGLDLYKIDLSGVVSKYIGETEKNLDRIFTAAENSNSIVFIDECDSLMGKRSEVRDAHDRYANIEIAYLLQKMEEYDGVVILATNLRHNLDESFVRRLAFTIPFPFPDAGHRRRIWESIWPDDTPLSNDLDLDFLSRQFKLSGGNIKNIALAAAFLAAADGRVVTMSHLIRATSREYQKLGRPLSVDELGEFAPEVSA